jgi:hypothetical protein
MHPCRAEGSQNRPEGMRYGLYARLSGADIAAGPFRQPCGVSRVVILNAARSCVTGSPCSATAHRASLCFPGARPRSSVGPTAGSPQWTRMCINRARPRETAESLRIPVPEGVKMKTLASTGRAGGNRQIRSLGPSGSLTSSAVRPQRPHPKNLSRCLQHQIILALLGLGAFVSW